jgi:two-component system OmpR family sensor kinase
MTMSLRRRLLLGFTVVAVALVASGVFLALTMRVALVDRVDRQLAGVPSNSGARVFLNATPGPDRQPLGSGQARPDRLSEFFFAVLNPDGELTLRSGPGLSRSTEPLPRTDRLEALARNAAFGQPSVGTVAAEGGAASSYRVRVTQRFDGGYDVVGLSLTDVDRTFDRIVIAEIATALGVLVILGVVAHWVLRQGVRPLDDIAAAADAITDGDLSRRVSHTSPSTEAGRVGIAFNRMLTELEDDIRQREEAEQRLKRFVADASHELRTPLTSIRGYADLWRQGGLRDEAALDDAMQRVEGEAARMGRLVEDMLLLARLDEGMPLLRGPVDLARLARECAADAQVVDPDRPINCAADEPVIVEGDEDRMRQVVTNLIGNARRHTPANTPISIATRAGGSTATLEVRDDGPGMDAATAARVFERFYRADPSRGRRSGGGDQGGSGLGLAIVAAIVAAHRGTVAVHTAPGAGARFVVSIPADRPRD